MKRIAFVILFLTATVALGAPEKWWDSYNRGVAAVNAKNYKVAADALQSAIAQTPTEVRCASGAHRKSRARSRRPSISHDFATGSHARKRKSSATRRPRLRHRRNQRTPRSAGRWRLRSTRCPQAAIAATAIAALSSSCRTRSISFIRRGPIWPHISRRRRRRSRRSRYSQPRPKKERN
jgi:hypothetical protein